MSAPPERAPLAPNPVVRAAWKLAAAFALLLGALLLAGLLLPGSWSGEASRTVRAPPDSVFPFLEAPARWDEWTPWPEMTFTHEGPASGVGARRSWDDAEAGSGTFTITEALRPERVGYRVEVAGMVTRGWFALEATPAGTQVTWREEGDFGMNPVLGWVAFSLRRRHGVELERRLGALATAVEARGSP